MSARCHTWTYSLETPFPIGGSLEAESLEEARDTALDAMRDDLRHFAEGEITVSVELADVQPPAGS